MSNLEEKKFEDLVEKIQYSNFKQQQLNDWRPKHTKKQTVVTFILLGFAFIAMGSVLVSYSDASFEFVQEYQEKCEDKLQPKNGDKCIVEFELKQKIEGTVYVYYQIDNMFQNHRNYVKSRHNQQLLGQYQAASELSDCQPVSMVKDLWPHQQKNLKGEDLDPDAPAVPCGLIAKSLFNDTYVLKDAAKKEVAIDNTGIAWETDLKYKFNNIDKATLPEGKTSYEQVQWISMKDEHFIVWMRAAGLPSFRKLWGKVENGLEKGKYTIEIANQYNVKPFDGNKAFVLATANFFGGKNYLLANFHFLIGGLCLLFTIVVLYDIREENKPKPDPKQVQAAQGAAKKVKSK